MSEHPTADRPAAPPLDIELDEARRALPGWRVTRSHAARILVAERTTPMWRQVVSGDRADLVTKAWAADGDDLAATVPAIVDNRGARGLPVA